MSILIASYPVFTFYLHKLAFNLTTDKIALYEARLVPRLTIRRITFNLTGENQIFLKFLTSTSAVARPL
jgi:hypothetical protein